jgi:acylphosphatase
MGVTRRLRIHGRVQGVFYRGWSVATARALGLRGWVRNRRDGSVEMLVQGEEEQVEAMIARCREGPSSARVDRVEIAEDSEDAPAAFEERPTA